jgi:hypothetical protein
MAIAKEALEGVNIAVVVGTIAAEPQLRLNAEGEPLVSFDVVSVGEYGRVTVPVSFAGECAAAEEGVEVCVAGYVRRRFFRAGSSVTSRTELVAEHVVPVRRKAQVRKAVQSCLDGLLTLVD